MKNQQFYQTTKPSKREATLLDLAKGFGYCLAAFVVAVGGTLAIVLVIGGCEVLSNFFKQKDMKTFNNNHKKLMQYLKELRRLGKEDSKFSINDLINTNCLVSLNEQLDRELIVRRKENSVLRAWNLVLDIKVPKWNIKKKRQYGRLLSYISSQHKELKNIVKIEDASSNRLKKEYEKIEKGINSKTK